MRKSKPVNAGFLWAKEWGMEWSTVTNKLVSVEDVLDGDVTYGQRWQVETVFSMIKRNQGAVVAARSYHARNREMRLAVLTHNIGILLARWLFYRAFLTPFPSLTEHDKARLSGLENNPVA